MVLKQNGLTAMKTQGGGPLKSDSQSEMQMANRFMQKGFTKHQVKLMAVWENKRIAAISSQMPNLTILAANAVAAGDQTRLSRSDRALLAEYARETRGDDCAGCGRRCSAVLSDRVPINDVMRCLMSMHSYRDAWLACTVFKTLPPEPSTLLTQLDFSAAL